MRKFIAFVFMICGLIASGSPARAGSLLYVSLYNNTAVTFDVSLPTAAAVSASQQTFASGFTNLLGGFDRIQGLDVDRDGNVYVVNRGAALNGSSAVEKISPSGVVSRFASGLGNVWGITFGPDGVLYVPDADSSNANSSSISRIDSSGNVSGFSSGLPLSGPYGLTFAPGSLLIVSNFADGSILQVNSAGVASKYYDPTVYALSNPKGLAWGPGGVYAANYGNSTVSVVTPLTATVFASSLPTITSPTDVAFDNGGNLYVTNFFNNTITKYDPAGNLLMTINTGTYAPLWLAFAPSAVPEIDPSSMVGAVALLAGAFALLERHRRR